MSLFYTILTNYGKTVLADALAAQKPLKISFIAVGDGSGAYYEPTETQTALRNERWRGNLNDLKSDSDTQGQVIAEGVIPHTVDGDWFAREIGLLDENGGLIAVGKYPETYIPSAQSGARSQVYISIVVKVDNVAAIELNINNNIVLASKAFVLEALDKGTEGIKSLFPQAIHSFASHRIAITATESNPLLGKGEIITYRKSKGGWWIKEKIVTGQYSGGASLPSKNCPVWRLGTLNISPHILTIKQTVINKTSGIATYDFTPTQFVEGDNKDLVTFQQFRNGASQFIDYSTTTKEKEINILFAATATTSPTMTVRIYSGSLLLSEEKINTSTESVAPHFTFGLASVRNPRPGSELRIRIVKDVAESYAYIAGINANFDDYIADDIDKVYTSTFTSKAVRTTQSGAMCYVFYEKNAGKFGGESHGGELPILQKIIIDGDVVELQKGTTFSCDSFRIVQETVIDYENGHKINCFTEHKFNGDGTHEFTGSFAPTANFQAVYAYCPMFTVDFDYFKKIKTPEYHDLAGYPEASNIPITYPATSYEIQSKDNLYTAGIVWSTSLKNVDSSRVAIKPYPTDSSTKLYAGLSTGRVITLDSFTVHQMRYYS